MRISLPALWGLSVVDWALTWALLGMGATEMNPLTAWLYGFSPWAALAAKQTVIGLCCYALWRLRLKWLAAACALLYGALILYELGLLGR